MSNLIQRLLLFFLGAPAFIVVAVFLPQAKHGAAVLFIFAIAAGSAAELAQFFRDKGQLVRKGSFVLLGTLPPIMAYAGNLYMDTPGGLGAVGLLGMGLAVMAVVAFAPFALVRHNDIAVALPTAAAYGLALLYPGLLGAFIVLVASEPRYAMESLLCFGFMTFGNDSLAWLTGVTLGRRRGIVAVSPNKSIAGFLGGMAGSVGFSFVTPLIFPKAMHAPWPSLLAFGIAVGAAVIFGDLFESALKRSAGAKDSGSYVPGRGGFLDSFDSLLFAAPIFYGLSLLLGLFR